MSKFIPCVEKTNPYISMVLECEFAEEQIIQEAGFMEMLDAAKEKILKLIDWILGKVSEIKSKVVLMMKNDTDAIDFSQYSFKCKVFDANPFFEFDKQLNEIEKMWKPFIDNNDAILSAENDLLEYMRDAKTIYKNSISVRKVKNALNVVEKKLKSLEDRIHRNRIDEQYVYDNTNLHPAFATFYRVIRKYAQIIKDDIETIYSGVRHK